MLQGWPRRVPSWFCRLHDGYLTVILPPVTRRSDPFLPNQPRCRYYSDVLPLRKQLKDDTKADRKAKLAGGVVKDGGLTAEFQKIVDEYELTVGIEIHAQLNTNRKLFSPALTAPTDIPNQNVAPFDLALPGSQPVFQFPVLVPALRAALTLGCTIQTASQFDRKHYFYHDQPSGYQITQYYHPFAKDGEVILTKDDGLVHEESLLVGIKQVQLEQDTARTQEQDHETNLIDFNRSGHALVEIISLPHIHSPEAAAAYVRKIQSLLFSVDAVTTGMELGGLRADVNVSVRRIDVDAPGLSYSGVTGLGQRTEIKNLSSFKGVEDAVRAERNRQIQILEEGGVVEGETRGWSITQPGVTRRLRSKEGEVDYRYMPDPDLPPLYIADEVIDLLKNSLPPSPSQLQQILRDDYGLSPADAISLLALDGGQRFIYFQDVTEMVLALNNHRQNTFAMAKYGLIVANWTLHELGALLSTTEQLWKPDIVPASAMATIIHLIDQNKLTNTSAKQVLRLVFEGDHTPVEQIVEREGLAFSAMSDSEYQALATTVMDQYPDHVKDIREKGKHGKIKFLMGQMMKLGTVGRIQAVEAEKCLKRLLLDHRGE